MVMKKKEKATMHWVGKGWKAPLPMCRASKMAWKKKEKASNMAWAGRRAPARWIRKKKENASEMATKKKEMAAPQPPPTHWICNEKRESMWRKDRFTNRLEYEI